MSNALVDFSRSYVRVATGFAMRRFPKARRPRTTR
jgi:hypothetical protein